MTRATSTTPEFFLCKNNPKEHNRMSSLKLLAPPPPHHQKGSVTTVSSVGSSSTEREYEDNQSFGLSPVCSAHSDANSTLPTFLIRSIDYSGIHPDQVIQLSKLNTIAGLFQVTAEFFHSNCSDAIFMDLVL